MVGRLTILICIINQPRQAQSPTQAHSAACDRGLAASGAGPDTNSRAGRNPSKWRPVTGSGALASHAPLLCGARNTEAAA